MTTDVLNAVSPTDPDLRKVKLLTVNQVAEILKLGRTTIYHLLRRQDNALPAVQIGGATRIALLDLEAWLRREKRGVR